LEACWARDLIGELVAEFPRHVGADDVKFPFNSHYCVITLAVISSAF
jgi:hypothetical protein